MINKIVLIQALIVSSILSLNAQTTITLQPNSVDGKDAILHGLASEASNNWGNSEQLSAMAWTFDGNPGVIRGLLDFDLSAIPSGATINSATLSLYAWDSGSGFGQHSTLSGSNECWVQRVTSTWDENTVTWNSQPSTTTLNLVSLSTSVSPSQNYTNINVSNLVQDMTDNPTTSFGFMIRLQNENYYRLMNFSSSDHTNSSLHPKLVVTYTAPSDDDTCFTLQPNAAEGKDALLHGLASESSNNWGNSPQQSAMAWTFDGNPGVIRSVLDFDLSAIPNGATINSALLSLYAWDSSNGFGQHSTLSGPNDTWLQRITSPWDENTVTWDSQPTTTTTNQVTLSSTVSPSQNFTNIDVSNLVQDMTNNPSSSYGFMLRLQNENYYRLMNFASSDHSNNALHPKLEVCYTPQTNALIEPIKNDIDFNLIPNPATDAVVVNVTSHEKQEFSIRVFSSTGQLIEEQNDIKSKSYIDVTNYSKGIYFVGIYANGSASTKKLIVK